MLFIEFLKHINIFEHATVQCSITGFKKTNTKTFQNHFKIMISNFMTENYCFFM